MKLDQAYQNHIHMEHSIVLENIISKESNRTKSFRNPNTTNV